MAKIITVTYKKNITSYTIPTKRRNDAEWIEYKMNSLINAKANAIITHKWEDEGVLPYRISNEGIKLGYYRDIIPESLLPEYDKEIDLLKQQITACTK